MGINSFFHCRKVCFLVLSYTCHVYNIRSQLLSCVVLYHVTASPSVHDNEDIEDLQGILEISLAS